MIASVSSSISASAYSQAGSGQLAPAQEQQVAKLKQIDQQVRDHEAAHIRAGGSLVTSGPSYTYTYGPDGKQYAVGGEVSIDTSRERKPADNIEKGQHIERAALAPAEPSPKDYQVAAVGEQLAAQGRADLAAEQKQAAAQTTGSSATGQQATKAYGSLATTASLGFSAVA